MLKRLKELAEYNSEDDSSSLPSEASKDDRPFGCFAKSDDLSPSPVLMEGPPEKRPRSTTTPTNQSASGDSNSPVVNSISPESGHKLTQNDLPSTSESSKTDDVTATDALSNGGRMASQESTIVATPAADSTNETNALTAKARTKRKHSSKGKSRGSKSNSSKQGKSLKSKRSSNVVLSSDMDGVGPETSNSSWAEMSHYMFGTFCMYPLTSAMQQRFILQYLAPLGEYQEVR